MNAWKKITQHSVARNAGALTLMQLARYIAPLLVLPYLSRLLGPHGFGGVMVAMAAIQLAFVVSDYGFSLSATHDISKKQNDREYINKKIGVVWQAKILLVSMAIIVLLLVPYIFPAYHEYHILFAACIPAIIGQAFQPLWLFLGLEKMRNVTTYMVVANALYIASVFFLVRHSGQGVVVILCWGMAQLAGLMASIVLMRKEGFSIEWQNASAVFQELRSSSQFFWSRIAVVFYTSLNTMVLGAISATQAAHYAACEQIYKASQGVTSPVSSALFPFMARKKDWRVFFLILSGTLICMLLGCILVGMWSGSVLALVFGEEYRSSYRLLEIFLITTLINYVCITFGYSAFAGLGKIWVANVSVFLGAVLHVSVISILYFCGVLSAVNLALSVLATESFVLAFRLIFFIRLYKIDVALRK